MNILSPSFTYELVIDNKKYKSIDNYANKDKKKLIKAYINRILSNKLILHTLLSSQFGNMKPDTYILQCIKSCYIDKYTNPLNIFCVVYDPDDSLTQFETLYNKTTNSLFIYNENIDQYSSVDYSIGGGNAIMRPYRTDLGKQNDKKNEVYGIPTDINFDKVSNIKTLNKSIKKIDTVLKTRNIKNIFLSIKSDPINNDKYELGLGIFKNLKNIDFTIEYLSEKLLDIFTIENLHRKINKVYLSSSKIKGIDTVLTNKLIEYIGKK